jgi:hypothetical protein
VKPKRDVKRWTDDEDDRLRAGVSQFGDEGNWREVAKVVTTRSHTQCASRWKKVLLKRLPQQNQTQPAALPAAGLSTPPGGGPEQCAERSHAVVAAQNQVLK